MTIKQKILLFALIVVLAPFSVLGYFAYSNSVRVNQARFGQELQSLGAWVAEETGRQVERLATNLEAFAATPLLRQYLTGESIDPLRVEAYFHSLLNRFSEYRRFRLADKEGVFINSSEAEKSLRLTHKSGVQLVTPPGMDPLLRVTVSITNGSDNLFGYLIADVDLHVLQPLLESTAGKRIYLASVKSRILDSSGALLSPTPVTTGDQKPVSGLESVMLYPDHRGKAVLGCSTPTLVDELSVLAEVDAKQVFAELEQLKTRFLEFLAMILLVLLVATSFFAASLVRPLNALVDGARRVAEGDLDVDLPSGRRDEIGYLSRVFNDMTVRLQESRQAVSAAQARLLEQNRHLEELAITDALTGLPNRRSLIENLILQLDRYRRNARPFSVLMLDVDHFKLINDRYGHLVGDDVLRQVAACLTESIRTVDFAARYGGEEFTIIAFETGLSEGRELAERIRAQVQQMRMAVDTGPALEVTASIGVAEVCDADVRPDDLLQRADAALYQAKKAGRNCVCSASAS